MSITQTADDSTVPDRSVSGEDPLPVAACRQCTRPDCLPADVVTESVDQPFDSESTGSSEDSDLIPIHSGEDWVALLDDDLSQPATISSDTFRITTLQEKRSRLHHAPIVYYVG